MIIPRHWSRATTDAVAPDGRTIPVEIWRGSRTSEAEAQQLARETADRVARRVQAGEGFPDRYTYGERDLREAVVEELGSAAGAAEPDAALTRNAYGAVVLNSTRACFIDVDVGAEPSGGSRSGGGQTYRAPQPGGGTGLRPVADRILGMFGVRTDGPLGSILDAVLGPASGGGGGVQEPAAPAAPASASGDPALAKLRSWVAQHPEWAVRVYRTSAGLRYLVTHAPFTPGDAASEAAMRAMGADPAYVKLCRVRSSFRARLTPKPWRIGLPKPPHRFPFESAAEEREVADWVRRYDTASQGHATCRFVEVVGSGAVHPEIEPLVRLHDEHTRATSGLPLA
jgi:hypothetical protein